MKKRGERKGDYKFFMSQLVMHFLEQGGGGEHGPLRSAERVVRGGGDRGGEWQRWGVMTPSVNPRRNEEKEGYSITTFM